MLLITLLFLAFMIVLGNLDLEKIMQIQRSHSELLNCCNYSAAACYSRKFPSVVGKGENDRRSNHPRKAEFCPLILSVIPGGIYVTVVELVNTALGAEV